MINKINKNRVTPEEQYGPRIAGRILREFLENSNDPLAVAYRERMAESEEDDDEDQLFKDLFPNTEPAVDLKLLTRKPGRLPVGVPVDGSIVNDGTDHFTFVQNAIERKKVKVHRTLFVLRCKFVNLHERVDGSYYPTFNRPRFSEDFSFQDFCNGAAGELQYFASLVERK